MIDQSMIDQSMIDQSTDRSSIIESRFNRKSIQSKVDSIESRS